MTRVTGLQYNTRGLEPFFEEIEHCCQQFSYVGSFWHRHNLVLAERFACDLRDSADFLFGKG